MRTITKILVVAVPSGTAAAPAFAYETALEFQTPSSRAQTSHVTKRSVRTLNHDALGAMAHAPAGAPLPYDRDLRDFGIGSQS